MEMMQARFEIHM